MIWFIQLDSKRCHQDWNGLKTMEYLPRGWHLWVKWGRGWPSKHVKKLFVFVLLLVAQGPAFRYNRFVLYVFVESDWCSGSSNWCFFDAGIGFITFVCPINDCILKSHFWQIASYCTISVWHCSRLVLRGSTFVSLARACKEDMGRFSPNGLDSTGWQATARDRATGDLLLGALGPALWDTVFLYLFVESDWCSGSSNWCFFDAGIGFHIQLAWNSKRRWIDIVCQASAAIRGSSRRRWRWQTPGMSLGCSGCCYVTLCDASVGVIDIKKYVHLMRWHVV